MDSKKEEKTITATNEADLIKQQTDLIAQGWNADSAVIKNDDGTFSQKMVKMIR